MRYLADVKGGVRKVSVSSNMDRESLYLHITICVSSAQHAMNRSPMPAVSNFQNIISTCRVILDSSQKAEEEASSTAPPTIPDTESPQPTKTDTNVDIKRMRARLILDALSEDHQANAES